MDAKTKIIALAGAAIALCSATVQAAFYGVPRWAKPQAERIAFNGSSLAPLGHTKFCMQYPKDCEVRFAPYRRYGSSLNEKRWAELAKVNDSVNTAISPQPNTDGLFGEEWLFAPEAGDCNDYAVTKRHRLLARGWPSRSLLLAEVVTAFGEHHLVLVVRTRDGDFVLDNLTDDIRAWRSTAYRWVRIQSPDNPKYWSTVGRAGGKLQRATSTNAGGV